MRDALCQRASHSSGTTGEVDRFVLRLRLCCVDDERDDVVSVEFWSGGEANRLPAELVSDRAFVRVGVFGSHRSFRYNTIVGIGAQRPIHSLLHLPAQSINGQAGVIASTRLDGQRGVLRPFTHRAVVKHQTFVSKPVQHEQINRR